MLSSAQAHALANTWRPRFRDATRFEASWQRYFSTVTAAARQSASDLERWLKVDQDNDALAAIGAPPLPIGPTRSTFQVLDESLCASCRGRRYVRFDLAIDHREFGRARRCPTCNGGVVPAWLTQDQECIS